jgi:hypothetical protein
VPGKDDVIPWLYQHLHWSRLSATSVRLKSITAPPADIGNGMARLAGTEDFQPADEEGSIASRYRVPAFLIEPAEFMLQDYRKLAGGRLTCEPEKLFELSPEDALPFQYEHAVEIAEMIGKRLPDALELQYAMSLPLAASRRVADLPEEVLETGPVGSVREDRLPGTPAVFGLHSNVGEWTTTWGLPGTQPMGAPSGEFSPAFNSRIVLGRATPRRSDRKTSPETALGTGTFRLHLYRDIGARMVRSLRPRLRPEDFPSPTSNR